MIGERLYDLRKDAGLTQEELASILNINKHSISSYERDKSEPPDEIKIKIAEYFHVSIDYLLGLTNNPSLSQEYSVFKLPANFPQEAINELKDFVLYLNYKYKK